MAGELILLVDDNAKLLSGMKLRLEMVGYQVLLAYDGLSALDLLKVVTPHLIVADVMMPRMNGWELFERVRRDPRLNVIPFIFVTARTDDESIQRAKSMGVEDYLTKPFKAEELEASIHGRLLRANQLSQPHNAPEPDCLQNSIQVNDLTIDLKSHRVFRGDLIINLSPMEFKILANLCQKAGQVFSLDELAQLSYPSNFDTWDARDSIRVHIKNLRKKIEPDPERPYYIVNVRGVGYRIETCPNDAELEQPRTFDDA
ncbi:MAG TPA: response regulator transcription factor [Anaerolineaceae bacterium]|nr:response regulator transcription factor [Anaerolineaceae bacterium]